MTASVASASPRLTPRDSTTNVALASRLRTRVTAGLQPSCPPRGGIMAGSDGGCRAADHKQVDSGSLEFKEPGGSSSQANRFLKGYARGHRQTFRDTVFAGSPAGAVLLEVEIGRAVSCAGGAPLQWRVFSCSSGPRAPGAHGPEEHDAPLEWRVPSTGDSRKTGDALG